MIFRLAPTAGGPWNFIGTVPMELARKTWPDRYEAVKAAEAIGYVCFADGSVKPKDDTPPSSDTPAEDRPKLIKYTSKIKRGMALARMVVMASMNDDMPPAKAIIAKWTQRQQQEFNDYLAWAEQEEDWESVADAWAKAGGK